MKPQFKVEEVSVDEPTKETEEITEPRPEPEPEPEPAEALEPEQKIETEPEEDFGFQAQDFAAGTQPEPEPMPQPTTNQFQFRQQPSRKFPWWIVIIIVLVIGLIIGMVKIIKGSGKTTKTEPASQDLLLMSPAPTNEPSPEPKEELDRKDLKVQVLNGSGTVGAAGKLAKALEETGFEDVKTGNADNYKYEGVIIRVKEGKLNIGELIEGDLKDYDEVTIEEELDEDSSWDAEVVLGKQPNDEKVQGASDEATKAAEKEE